MGIQKAIQQVEKGLSSVGKVAYINDQNPWRDGQIVLDPQRVDIGIPTRGGEREHRLSIRASTTIRGHTGLKGLAELADGILVALKGINSNVYRVLEETAVVWPPPVEGYRAVGVEFTVRWRE